MKLELAKKIVANLLEQGLTESEILEREFMQRFNESEIDLMFGNTKPQLHLKRESKLRENFIKKNEARAERKLSIRKKKNYIYKIWAYIDDDMYDEVWKFKKGLRSEIVRQGIQLWLDKYKKEQEKQNDI